MSSAEKLMDFETRPGVTYATHDSVALAGDLYLPKGAGPFPVMVGVHGGGWVQGARSAFQYWGPWFAARGVALFAVTYRLAKANQKTFPHAVQDVMAAVQ
ncbi:MAG TPA: peptidase, partial [Xanthobacteraceae bacterium]